MTKWSRLNGPGREANERGRALECQFLGCYSTAPHRLGTLSIICTCPARWTDEDDARALLALGAVSHASCKISRPSAQKSRSTPNPRSGKDACPVTLLEEEKKEEGKGRGGA
jgi:hypothetical protein